MKKLILSLVIIIVFIFIWNRVTIGNRNKFEGTYIGSSENISIDLRVSENEMEAEWYLDIKDTNNSGSIDIDSLKMDLILQSGKTISLTEDKLFRRNRGISDVEVDSMPSKINVIYNGHEELIKLINTTSN